MSIELDTNFEQDELVEEVAQIKVIGVGGGGCNAVDNMISKGLVGVEFIQVNTDVQSLRKNKSRMRAQIGRSLTGGKGSGADPEIGRLAAEENYEDLKSLLAGTDMVFIAAGMGKGTGTGASPVVARIAKEVNALVVGIVTLPFHTEATQRYNAAMAGVNELRKYVDTLIVIPNDKLDRIANQEILFNEAYKIVDDVLYHATKGIAEIIIKHGYINVDFADVKTVMKDKGDAIMGIGVGVGESRAAEAAQNAIQSPLLDDVNINGAQGVLINICSNQQIKYVEVQEILRIVQNATGDNVNLIYGVILDENATDELSVTVVATGFQKQSLANNHNTVIRSGNNTPVIFNDEPNQVLKSNDLIINKSPLRISPVNGGVPINNLGINNVGLKGPKGTSELEKYDSPAYQRQNQTTELDRKEINEEVSIHKIPISTLDKPAFIRKMMN